MICIYALINLINGKKYIGSTNNLSRRKNEHLWYLRSNKHHSPALQRAWNKYGENAFKFIVLESIEDILSLNTREEYWMSTLKTNYNAQKSARCKRGHKFGPQSQETKLLKRVVNKRKKSINQLTLLGEVIQTWDSMREAERQLSIQAVHISQVCKGKRKTAGGYKWQYN